MRIIVISMLFFLAGCSTVPVPGFAPTTTVDGKKGFIYVARKQMFGAGIDEGLALATLPGYMGRYHACPDGWEITSRVQTAEQITWEGVCK